MKNNHRIGKWGEQVVVEYPVSCGLEVFGRNVRTPYGEIDIVAKQGHTTSFVVVKTRISNKMGLPEESIMIQKRKHMTASTKHYVAELGIEHWQIDAIAIEGKPGTEPLITYFENAI